MKKLGYASSTKKMNPRSPESSALSDYFLPEGVDSALVYLDESGNTGTNLTDTEQPIFLLAA